MNPIQITVTGRAARLVLAELAKAYAFAECRSSLGGRFLGRAAREIESRGIRRDSAAWRKAEAVARADELAASSAEAAEFRAALESAIGGPVPAVPMPAWPPGRLGRPVYNWSLASRAAEAFSADLVAAMLGES